MVTLGNEDISDIVDSGAIRWDTSGEYDGWERAGAEAWMRKGYQNDEPVIIQKSGNAYATLNNGTLLDEIGAHIAPTAMYVDDNSLSGEEQRLDYEIYQQFVSAPGDDDLDMIDFRNRYSQTDDLTDDAIKQFAENCAAIDAAGYRPVGGGKSVLRDFLTEGDECYLVDFGYDLGSPAEPVKQNDYSLEGLSENALAVAQQNVMRDTGYDFLDDTDTGLFQDTYETARRDILESCSGDVDVDRLMDAQDMSAYERRHLKEQGV